MNRPRHTLGSAGPRGVAEVRGNDGSIRHADDLTVCAGSERCQRACVSCGLPPVDGHDACIADLPGVEFACCGHGDPTSAYVKFRNGVIIRHFDTIEYGPSIESWPAMPGPGSATSEATGSPGRVLAV